MTGKALPEALGMHMNHPPCKSPTLMTQHEVLSKGPFSLPTSQPQLLVTIFQLNRAPFTFLDLFRADRELAPGLGSRSAVLSILYRP